MRRAIVSLLRITTLRNAQPDKSVMSLAVDGQNNNRMPIRFSLLVFLLLCGWSLFAQVPPDSIRIPGVKNRVATPPPGKVELEIPKIKEPRVYVPRQALLWSVIPGGGQVYNRRWWKVPLVFSAFSGVVAVLDFNQSNYDRFRVAYQLELAGQEHEFSDIGYSADALRSLRNNFNKSRQTNYFMLLAVYVLQGVEAYVDTHLRNFDMDEDLSRWQITPQVLPSPTGQQPAHIVLQFQYSF